MLRDITDKEIREAYENISLQVQDMIFNEKTALKIDRLTDVYRVLNERKHTVAEEILFILLKITNIAEASLRLNERIGIDNESSTQLLKQFFTDVGIEIPTKQDLIKDDKVVPVGIAPDEQKDIKDRLDLRPEAMLGKIEAEHGGEEMPHTPAITLGDVPDASSELKEKLELRPKVMKRAFPEAPETEEESGEDDGPKPLTRTEILQSLSPKRTMASDIESIKKTDDATDTRWGSTH